MEWLEVGDDSAGMRLDNFLLKRLKGAPQSLIYRIIRSGEVRVNKGRAQASSKIALGDVVRVPPVRLEARSGAQAGRAGAGAGVAAGTDVERGGHAGAGDAGGGAGAAGVGAQRARLHQVRAGSDLDIIFEDDALLAINKPSGLAVHGGSGVSFGVIEALRAARPDAKFLELVHRIDRDTSGVLLLAKKRTALVAMHALLREGKTDKRYFALVKGDWPHTAKHHITTSLAKYVTEAGERRVAAADDAAYSKDAHTIVSVVKRYGAGSEVMTLIEAQIKTGRTHQIRVHLAGEGYPIAGDDKYGDFAFNKREAKRGLKRLFLHAAKMAFVHPVTETRVRVEAPLPPDCEAYLQQRFAHPGAH